MTRFGKLLVCVALLTSGLAQPASAQLAKGKDKAAMGRWAILIGVNDYSELADLEYCNNDQVALRAQLIASGFPEKQVFLLHDDAKDKQYLPFKRNIEKQLELVLGLLEKDDLVVVAFSGHGVTLEGKSYFCPTDASLKEPQQTMISVETFYQRLEKSQAALKVMMVDACRNDPRVSGARSVRAAKESSVPFFDALQRPPRGILLLTSCAPGEMSMEDKDLGHGVFMHHVLKGLKGEADSDRSGGVSLSELWQYANKETKVYVARKFNDSQRPGLKGNLEDDFDLSLMAKADATPNKPAVKPLPNETLPANGSRTLTNSIGMKLVQIPAGEFEMGEDSAAHRVRISKLFYLGVYEVTQSQYEQVMKTNPSWFSKSGGGKDKVSGLETSDCPVESVSWENAQDFCRKLSALNGEQSNRRLYRLPTEAEWEYACRAGTKTKFHFGDVLNGDKANVDGTNPEGTTTNGPYLQRTTSVGRYGANAFGLYDMHGNVWEWCEDVYDGEVYSKRSGLTTDPLVTSGSDSRVLRGGSWLLNSGLARSANRVRYTPGNLLGNYGFRVVCAVASRTQ